jgi:hypothetical protein
MKSSTPNLRRRRGLRNAVAGLLAGVVIAVGVIAAIPNGAPLAAAAAAVVVAAPKAQVSAGAVPAVVITGVSAMAGGDQAAIHYSAPVVYATYDDVSVVPGGPAVGPNRFLAGLHVRVTVPAQFATGAPPVLGASTVDQVGNWRYLGSQIVGTDRAFDYAYAGTLVVTPAGPSPLLFGFPMTFGRQAGTTGSGSVGFALTATSPFAYMANAGIPGGPANRCLFASGAVTCGTDLRVF